MKRHQKTPPEHIVNVSYPGSLNPRHFDTEITVAAGRKSDGSGYCFITGERDLSFWFRTRQGAENCAIRIRGEKIHRRLKVRVYHDI